MAEFNWSDDFQTGGENHAVAKTVDGLKLAVKPVLEFHGASYYGDRVRIPASPSLNVAGPMTLLARVLVNTPSRGDPFMEYDDLGVHMWSWVFGTAAGGKLFVNFRDTGGVAHTLNGAASLQAGVWYDAAAVFDGSNGLLFLNGMQDASAALGAFTPKTGTPLWLGYRPSSAASNYRSLYGKIAWAALFAGALTAEQIASLRYRIPKPDEPGLRGYWFLDEGAGTQAKDFSVNGNHGTLEGPSTSQLPAWVPGEKRMGVRFITLDLSRVGIAESSRIQWSSTEPTGTAVTIETNLSLDGGKTWKGWKVCTNGGTIPDMGPGTNLSNARLKVWEHLHTTDLASEPILASLAVTVVGTKNIDWSDDFESGGPNKLVHKQADGLHLSDGFALSFDGAATYVLPSSLAAWRDLTQSVTNNFTEEVGLLPTATNDADPESTSGTGGTMGERHAVYPLRGVSMPAFGMPSMWGAGHAGSGLSVGTNRLEAIEHDDNYMPIVAGVNVSLSGRCMLALVYETHVPKLYRDGVLLRSGLASSRMIHPSAGFGFHLAGYGVFEGRAYFLYVWDHPRSADQLLQDYYRIPKPDEPGLLLAWLLDEGSGTVVSDWSKNGIHGTLNGPTWVAGLKRAGVRIVELDLSSVGAAQFSKIEWTSTEPANTGVTIETNLSLDGGLTWQGWAVCTNGRSIPGITQGLDLSNARLKIWEHLHTTDPSVEPVLHGLTISIHGAVSVRLPRRAIPVLRPGRIHPVPHRGRVDPLP